MFSITNAQFEAMRAAICDAFSGTGAARDVCAWDGHKQCRKAANAALRALRKAGVSR